MPDAIPVSAGSDPQTDVAVLKTEKSELRPAKLATQFLEHGDIVLAIGSPFRYAFSLPKASSQPTDAEWGFSGPRPMKTSSKPTRPSIPATPAAH
jgi:S1-C subfamily serine protease